MTFLSIVIPVYNAEKTIDDLCLMLMSLLVADYLLEIVLINDYIPVELYDVTQSVTWPKITVLIVNVTIVAYLFYDVMKRRIT